METGFYNHEGELCADGVSLAHMAKEIETPAYIYSAGHIRSQFIRLSESMRKALPDNRQPLLCYACKANSNLAILDLLRREGSGLEVVSEGELMRGLRAGFRGERIVATGVGKQASEIAAGLKAGIRQFNVESLPELEHIQKIATETGKIAKVAFRLNPDVSGGGHHKISTGRKRDKFGLSMEKMHEAYAMAATMSHVEAIGLSMHIGSQVFDVKKFQEAFSTLPQIVRALRVGGHTVSSLDIGGGFPIVYKDEKLLDLDHYARWVRDIILPLDTDIIMEPGRYLVGNGGVILSRVLYVKEAGDRRFLILDAAMNDLIRPAMYDAYHEIEPVRNRAAAPCTYDIVGPVCETGDTFATDRVLPEMKAGDLCVIRSAGAYGASMGSNYNTRPLAAEILVEDGEYHVIRPRQSVEELLQRETIPSRNRNEKKNIKTA